MSPPKPHRILLDRVSVYADEAAAFMRRRRYDDLAAAAALTGIVAFPIVVLAATCEVFLTRYVV